jgi:hypothetical protein
MGGAGVAFQKPACNDENDADYKPERYTNLYSSQLFTLRFGIHPSLRHNPHHLSGRGTCHDTGGIWEHLVFQIRTRFINCIQLSYPATALSISIAKNTPDIDIPISFVFARSAMLEQLGALENVPLLEMSA